MKKKSTKIIKTHNYRLKNVEEIIKDRVNKDEVMDLKQTAPAKDESQSDTEFVNCFMVGFIMGIVCTAGGILLYKLLLNMIFS